MKQKSTQIAVKVNKIKMAARVIVIRNSIFISEYLILVVIDIEIPLAPATLFEILFFHGSLLVSKSQPSLYEKNNRLSRGGVHKTC